MSVYLLLFATGMANEALLTSYYLNAAKGRRWLCVALALGQQVVSIAATFYTLVDVVPGSREQFIRWAITACSYGCATALVVKPASAS